MLPPGVSSSGSRLLHAAIALLGLLTASVSAAKRGLCYNDGVPTHRFGPNSQVVWGYNWDSDTNQPQSWAPFVPMLWGLQDFHTSHWSRRASSWLDRGSGHLLSFNEPDLPSQANLAVDVAVEGHRVHMGPFAGRAQIGSPAVTNGGFDWLRSFLEKCGATNGCKVDFINVHWYDDWHKVDQFKSWIDRVCGLAGGRPVWITEFKGLGSLSDQANFLGQVIPWLDNNACVHRYAYFGVCHPDKDLLRDGGPELSDLGQKYAFTPFGGGGMRL